MDGGASATHGIVVANGKTERDPELPISGFKLDS
jgi:hypothetical protein